MFYLITKPCLPFVFNIKLCLRRSNVHINSHSHHYQQLNHHVYEKSINLIWLPELCLHSLSSYIFLRLINNHHLNQNSQELQMLSLSLFIQGSQWMMRLSFSIAKNVISVSHTTNLLNRIIQIEGMDKIEQMDELE